MRVEDQIYLPQHIHLARDLATDKQDDDSPAVLIRNESTRGPALSCTIRACGQGDRNEAPTQQPDIEPLLNADAHRLITYLQALGPTIVRAGGCHVPKTEHHEPESRKYYDRAQFRYLHLRDGL